MAHQFTVNETIHGVSIEDFSRLVAMTSLHEAVCKRIPGENLEIIESAVKGDIYTLRREYNLDVNIPEVAKKLINTIKNKSVLFIYHPTRKYVNKSRLVS